MLSCPSIPACPIPPFPRPNEDISAGGVPLTHSTSMVVLPPLLGRHGKRPQRGTTSRGAMREAPAVNAPPRSSPEREIPSSKDALLSYDGLSQKKWKNESETTWVVGVVWVRSFVAKFVEMGFFFCVVGWKVWVKFGRWRGNGIGKWCVWSTWGRNFVPGGSVLLGIEGDAKGAWSVKTAIE